MPACNWGDKNCSCRDCREMDKIRNNHEIIEIKETTTRIEIITKNKTTITTTTNKKKKIKKYKPKSFDNWFKIY